MFQRFVVQLHKQSTHVFGSFMEELFFFYLILYHSTQSLFSDSTMIDLLLQPLTLSLPVIT